MKYVYNSGLLASKLVWSSSVKKTPQFQDILGTFELYYNNKQSSEFDCGTCREIPDSKTHSTVLICWPAFPNPAKSDGSLWAAASSSKEQQWQWQGALPLQYKRQFLLFLITISFNSISFRQQLYESDNLLTHIRALREAQACCESHSSCIAWHAAYSCPRWLCCCRWGHESCGQLIKFKSMSIDRFKV